MEITIDDLLEMGHTDNNPEVAYNRGVWLKKMNRFSDAIKDFTDAINLKENYMEAHIERALCYHAIAQNDLAINDATQAINLAKTITTFKKANYIATYLEVRSRFYIAKNDILNAFKDLNESCEITFTNAFDSRGVLYFNEKNYEEALRDFTQMSIIYENNSLFPYKMAICHLKMNNKNKAIELLKKSQKLGSTEATKLLNRLI